MSSSPPDDRPGSATAHVASTPDAAHRASRATMVSRGEIIVTPSGIRNQQAANDRGTANEILPHNFALGRYLVLDPLISIGTHQIYSALDLTLCRRVALRVLEQSAEPKVRIKLATARESHTTLRELLLLAKLAHPNLIPIFDTGFERSMVYWAMELVEGVSYTQWLATSPSPEQVYLRFPGLIEALAATHEREIYFGLLEENHIRVGNDDAAYLWTTGPLLHRSYQESSVSGHQGNRRWTEQVFIAPELRRGAPPSIRTDIYAMCALLYRGIYEHAHYGVRGEGSVDPELEFPRKSRGQRIPTAVIDALRIGLSADPEARFANADELLAALSGIDWERHQHVVTNTLGGIAGTACLIAAMLGASQGGPDPCASAWPLTSVASPTDYQTQLTSRLATENIEDPSTLATRLATALGDRIESWGAARTEVCNATRQRPDDELLDARTSCLHDRLEETNDLIKLMLEGKSSALSRSAELSLALSPISACSADEVRRRRGTTSEVASAETSAAVRQALLQSAALQTDDALKILREQHERILETGKLADLPKLIDTLESVYSKRGEHEMQHRTGMQLCVLATAFGQDLHLFSGLQTLAFVEGYLTARPATMHHYLRAADTALARSDTPRARDVTRANLWAIYAAISQSSAASIPWFEAANEAAANGQIVDKMTVAHNLGVALLQAGRFTEARGAFERVMHLSVTSYGAAHPTTQEHASSLREVYLMLGEDEAAWDAMEHLVRDASPEVERLDTQLTTRTGYLGTQLVLLQSNDKIELARAAFHALLQKANAQEKTAGRDRSLVIATTLADSLGIVPSADDVQDFVQFASAIPANSNSKYDAISRLITTARISNFLAERGEPEPFPELSDTIRKLQTSDLLSLSDQSSTPPLLAIVSDIALRSGDLAHADELSSLAVAYIPQELSVRSAKYIEIILQRALVELALGRNSQAVDRLDQLDEILQRGFGAETLRLLPILRARRFAALFAGDLERAQEALVRGKRIADTYEISLPTSYFDPPAALTRGHVIAGSGRVMRQANSK